jgi:hypothetical protein
MDNGRTARRRDADGPFFGSSLFQVGEYFEILAARVDPGRIRKR